MVLAGDIVVESDVDFLTENFEQTNNPFHIFMQGVCKKYSHVVYVTGNHESYGGDFSTTMANLRSKFAYLPNLHILDNEIFELNSIVFIGSTLWSDFNGNDPTTMEEIRFLMNDFAVVRNGKGQLFTPEDAFTEHQNSLKFIQQAYDEINRDKQIVVVTHHAPTFNSIEPDRKDEFYLNGGYATDLRNFIERHNRIKVWINGHTHHQVEYMVGDTKVICHPRGYYPFQSTSQSYRFKVIDI